MYVIVKVFVCKMITVNCMQSGLRHNILEMVSFMYTCIFYLIVFFSDIVFN